jgi:hypothetical protein
MSRYSKETWVDRSVQYPRRYQDELTNVKTWTPDPGTVTEAGTDITATRMNKIESGIFDAYYQAGATPPETGTASFTYSGDELTVINEYVGGTLFRKTTNSYSGGYVSAVNTKIYDTDGTTVLRDWTISITILSDKITATSTIVNV